MLLTLDTEGTCRPSASPSPHSVPPMVDTLSGTAPLFPSGLLSQILLPVAGQRLTELTVEDFTLEGCQHKGLGAAREQLCKVTVQDRTDRVIFGPRSPLRILMNSSQIMDYKPGR